VTKLYVNDEITRFDGSFLAKTLLLSSQKYGAGIRDPEKLIPNPDPEVKKEADPGSGTLDMKRCKMEYIWPMSLDLLCLTSACFT
jgi:hypothetical protein